MKIKSKGYQEEYKQTWENIWHKFELNIIERIYRRWLFREYTKILSQINLFSNSKNKEYSKLKIAELGCGTGLLSILLAKELNVNLTLIDLSQKALKISKYFAKKMNVDANFICEDIFELSLDSQFDFVHSEGLIEHFKYPERQKIVEVHANLLRDGGHTLIIVPKDSFAYWMGRRILQNVDKWDWPWEEAISNKELINLCAKAGLKPIIVRNFMLRTRLGVLGKSVR